MDKLLHLGGTILKDIWETLSSKADGGTFLDVLENGVTGISEWWDENGKDLLELISAFAEMVIISLGRVAESFGKTLGMNGKEDNSSIIKTLTSLLTIINDIMLLLPDFVFQFITLGMIFNGLKLGKVISMLDKVVELLAVATGLSTGAVAGIIASIGAMVLGEIDFQSNIADEIDTGSKIKDAIAKQLTGIATGGVLGHAQLFVAKIPSMLGLTDGKIVEVFEEVQRMIARQLNNIFTGEFTFEGLFTDLKGVAKLALENMGLDTQVFSETFKMNISSAIDFGKAKWQDLSQFTSTVWTGMGTIVSTSTAMIQGKVNTMIESIKSKWNSFTSLITNLPTIVSNAFSSFYTTVVTYVDKILEYLRKLTDFQMPKFDNPFSNFRLPSLAGFSGQSAMTTNSTVYNRSTTNYYTSMSRGGKSFSTGVDRIKVGG